MSHPIPVPSARCTLASLALGSLLLMSACLPKGVAFSGAASSFPMESNVGITCLVLPKTDMAQLGQKLNAMYAEGWRIALAGNRSDGDSYDPFLCFERRGGVGGGSAASALSLRMGGSDVDDDKKALCKKTLVESGYQLSKESPVAVELQLGPNHLKISKASRVFVDENLPDSSTRDLCNIVVERLQAVRSQLQSLPPNSTGGNADSN